ncbi:SPOR domain-containing protein [Luteimonas sp. SX5]|uniref:SPOR domain-containing protein n=1 Tax=Luteimonas galliterrae TaxID=2940486 RepID=A0ABT0MIL1_9GAMM|nr:SPOR domain-containing protein [Luteimonas galliterrae]MCL1634700.1 SPOR domain-containing protein [Luteimonas galliterrae]
MFARALIVLLIAINVGVAMWWLLRGEPPAPPAFAQPAGVPRLQLLSEAKPLAAAPAPTAPVPVVAAPAPVAPNQCFSLGPFATSTTLREASAKLRPQVVRLSARETTPANARGYTVLMPSLATRELAQAAAERIKAAGFDDYLLINEGADANGIALGRYGSQESAQRRQAALQAAGFAAEIRPIGDAGPAWLDIEARAGLDLAKLRTDAGAAQAQPLDCASLR